MHLTPQPSFLKRQDSSQQGTTPVQYIAAGTVLGVLVLIIAIVGTIFYFRKKRSLDRHRRLASADDSELQARQPETSSTNAIPSATRRQSSNRLSGNFASNRLSTRSIASIMTLPPYKETPAETEEIIAREGEREGLDYIIEGPETAEELEARRQEEVTAIYRVQQTRRRELEERAERRRARRAALDAQDYREVARLDRAAAEARQRERNGSVTSVGQNSQSSAGANSNLSAVAEGLEPGSHELLRELQDIRAKRGRVASVAYTGVGTQRHDGSRLRAASIESDSQPLLDSAGNMGGRSSTDFRSSRSRASSVNSANGNAHGNSSNETIPGTDNRERSRSRASSRGAEQDPRIISMQLSEDGIPPEPPSYDDDLSVHGPKAPRYEDVVLDSPRHSADHSADQSVDHTPHPHAEVHEVEDDEFEDVDVRGAPSEPVPKAPSAVPLRLQTTIPTPSIEVVTATPIHSRPGTPSSSAGGTQRPPTDRR